MMLLIGVPTLVIYVVILGLALSQLKADARRGLDAEMTSLAEAYAARFDAAFREVAVNATANARLMEVLTSVSESLVFEELAATTADNPSIYGAAMAFEPGVMSDPDELYCPYVYRDGDEITQMFISRDVYDWYGDEQWDWWHIPKKTGEPTWSAPYFDEGAGNVLMVTYSVPFHRDETFTGVTTVDVRLPTLREVVGGSVAGDLDFVILTRDGSFVFSPVTNDIMERTIFDVARDLDQPQLNTLGARMTNGESGVATIDHWAEDDRTFVFFAPISSTSWSFAARVPAHEALAGVRARIAWASGFLGFALVMIILCIWLVSGRIVRPVERLRTKVLEIAGGNLDARIDDINSKDEIGELALSFNQMTDDLRTHIEHLANERVARERIERDLDIAREIQQGLLPKSMPDLPGYEIAGWNQAAEKTGGDFFDWLQLHDGRTVITLADVTGHGIGPALIVAVCRAYLRASASSGNVDLCDAMNRVNNLLHADIPDGRFVTAAVSIIDPVHHRVAMVSAGQAPILYYEHATGTVHDWDANVLPLGIISHLECDQLREFDIHPGDMLVMVTDGFFEWMRERGGQYGKARLIEFTRNHHDLAPEALIQALHKDVVRFAEGAPQADDLTALVLRRTTESRHTSTDD